MRQIGEIPARFVGKALDIKPLEKSQYENPYFKIFTPFFARHINMYPHYIGN